ncbi:MAG: metal ABC transporter ATP-binding protein [Chloroflexi bacterium]|nr:MAG: metal ABC transporter ATP-binding protein [Chloroflexota bacterium]
MARLRSREVVHRADAPTVEVDRVSVSYNGKLALEDISFRLEAGERVAVVGPNGAGKSTLFKVIAGTMSPSAGQVRVYGRGPHGHICIAYVPQRNQIDWTFPVTVADVVMMGRVGRIGLFRWPSRRDWEMVHSSLEQVGMQDFANRPIGELSGGQQQRVFIARALAQEAELLLLDEPLTGLDVPSREAIFQILDDLQRRGVTVLVATHDLNLASEQFDLTMLLNRRLMAFGRPEDVLTTSVLLQAYGGHMHVVPAEDGTLVLADTCCDGTE